MENMCKHVGVMIMAPKMMCLGYGDATRWGADSGGGHARCVGPAGRVVRRMKERKERRGGKQVGGLDLYLHSEIIASQSSIGWSGAAQGVFKSLGQQEISCRVCRVRATNGGVSGMGGCLAPVGRLKRRAAPQQTPRPSLPPFPRPTLPPTSSKPAIMIAHVQSQSK